MTSPSRAKGSIFARLVPAPPHQRIPTLPRRTRIGLELLEARNAPAGLTTSWILRTSLAADTITSAPSGQPSAALSQISLVQEQVSAVRADVTVKRVLDDSTTIIEAPDNVSFDQLSSSFSNLSSFQTLIPNRVGDVRLFDPNSTLPLSPTPGQWILRLNGLPDDPHEQQILAQRYIDAVAPGARVVTQLGRSGEMFVTSDANATREALINQLAVIPGFQSLEPNRLGWVSLYFPTEVTAADRVVPRHWIVQIENIPSGTTAQRRNAVQSMLDAADTDAAALYVTQSFDIAIIESKTGMSFETLNRRLVSVPGFHGIGPSGFVSGHIIPNDTGFTNQYGAYNVGQAVGSLPAGILDADLDATEAWDVTTGGSSNVVAVVDTGIDYEHPDIGINLWTNTTEANGKAGVDDDLNGFIDDLHGYNFVNYVAAQKGPIIGEQPGPVADDNHGHGTHVAGIIGARFNGTGTVGMNWNCQMMAIKFLDSQQSGKLEDAIVALDYVQTMKTKYGVNIRLSNNSWGGTLNDPNDVSALESAIGKAASAGMLFVASAGNNGVDLATTKIYPATSNQPNVVTVAATDNKDQLTSFSNFGAAVEVAAPGMQIYSTVPFSNATKANPSGYAFFDGTSQAAPYVSGTALLAWSKTPSATYAEIRDAIIRYADPIAIGGGKFLGPNGTNNVRLNALGTVMRSNKSIFATGAGSGGGPHVRVYAPRPDGTQVEKFGFFAYVPNFTGGVRVAVGDVTGDGIPDIVTVPGIGTSTNLGPLVRIWNGIDGKMLSEFYAYAVSIQNGLFVAAGDFNGDGKADVVTAPDAGAGPHVKVFDGTNNTMIYESFPYDPFLTMGVRVAAGDTNGDGRADVVTGPGPGGGPHVKVISGAVGNPILTQYFAYDAKYTGGIHVGTAIITTDGKAEVLISPESNHADRPVKYYEGDAWGLLTTLAAFPGYAGSVRLAAADFDGDGDDETIFGRGSGLASLVEYWRYSLFSHSKIGSNAPYGSFTGGVFVG